MHDLDCLTLIIVAFVFGFVLGAIMTLPGD